MKSVNHTKKFTQPNIKDILRRAAALRNALGVVLVVYLIRKRMQWMIFWLLFDQAKSDRGSGSAELPGEKGMQNLK